MSNNAVDNILEMNEVDEIFQRIRQVIPNIGSTDAAIARVLGVDKTLPGKWRKEKQMPYGNLHGIVLRYGINYIWLTTGKGNKFISDSEFASDVNCIDDAGLRAMKLISDGITALELAGITNPLTLLADVERCLIEEEVDLNTETRYEALQYYELTLQEEVPKKTAERLLRQHCKSLKRFNTTFKTVNN